MPPKIKVKNAKEIQAYKRLLKGLPPEAESENDFQTLETPDLQGVMTHPIILLAMKKVSLEEIIY